MSRWAVMSWCAGPNWGVLARGTVGVAVWLAVVGGATFLVGQEMPDDLSFRRVYFPADRLTEIPIGGERYVPLRPEEIDHSAQAVPGDLVQPKSEPAAITEGEPKG